MAGLALLATAAVVVLSASQGPSALEQKFPQTDVGMLKLMRDMAGPAPKTTTLARAAPKKEKADNLSMPQQYARIMQNMGYFAPWSRQNSWADRLAINNIRKANTPQALAQRQQEIQKENAKFAKKFSSPHTSQYTGVHQALSDILDPKYQPWANDAPRKAYYQGY
eukprot:CAMPEP_0184327096 /NCGR_PEP_ID=MMETSP1049-20130417/142914_1 /TAXON_ID=77928 /ORGANISM="Proteomonas sulcata, Strain CCMP704" /LENGTH=165 /DNA_ID=CAMNT_0026649333 /DNA_START=749 /DNA_END=1246 /DNA_ORIENTATION=-